jgi:4-hydroxybenzoate polyprenyltransferase
MSTIWAKTRITLEMIKWEHSIFALPFALTGALLAAQGLPPLRTLAWILVAMVSAISRHGLQPLGRRRTRRSQSAHPNPRHPRRVAFPRICTGLHPPHDRRLSHRVRQLNRLTLELSPIVLAVLLGYSYMKRVTRWSHLVLGLALGIAPSAAWIAVRGSLDWRIALLTAIVTCWVAGFDILYACQDMEHDRQAGLFSIPQALGLDAAFWTARALHLTVVLLLPGSPGSSTSALVTSGSLSSWCAAALRTSAGFSARPAQAQRRILHHERRHSHGLPRLRRYRYLAAKRLSPDSSTYDTATHPLAASMVFSDTRTFIPARGKIS